MIPIIYDKSDKKIAIQIYNKLKSRGFETSTDDIDNFMSNPEQIENIQAAVLIFSSRANASEQIIEKYEKIFENAIPLIPFIITDVDLNLTTKHFLNTHDWINAFNISTHEAIDDLITLLEEITNEAPAIEQKTKPVKTKAQSQDSKKKNQTIAIIAVSLLFIAILAYMIFGTKTNNPINPTSDPNELLVGNWKLANYQDNMQRTQQEYIDYINGVNSLKQNFLLKFKKDGTFEKYGFAKPETGNWQLDPQNMELHMWPPNSTIQKSDVLKIEKLTTDSLIMTIATKIDSLTLINTKFTLYKE